MDTVQTPELQTLDTKLNSLSEILQVLDQDGGVIVHNMLSPQVVINLRKELAPASEDASVLLLTSCSTPSPFESLAAGDCSDTQQVAVEKHITGQISAIAAEDWPKAYTYAAKSFQNSIKLEQFTAIVATQYQMLINNQGFTFVNCVITSSGVSQEVEVDDPRGNYLLLYQLEVDQLQLGVVAASVIEASEAINT